MNDMTREDLLALVTNRETVTRRDFVTGSLATGFALAVQDSHFSQLLGDRSGAGAGTDQPDQPLLQEPHHHGRSGLHHRHGIGTAEPLGLGKKH